MIVGAGNVAQAYTIKTTDSGEMVHWTEDAIGMRIQSGLEEYFAGLPVRDAIVASTEAWRDLPGVPDVLINEGEPGVQGFEPGVQSSNGIYLLEEWPLAESSLAVTVATFESNTGRMVDADILVNAQHPFSLLEEDPEAQPLEQFDLHSVMSHEIGHVLGLGESFDERMATMWPNIARGEIHQRDVHEDDMDGVSEIYATMIAQGGDSGVGDSQQTAAMGCGSASVTGRTYTQGAGVWALVLLALGALFFVVRRSARTGALRRSAPALSLLVLFGAPFDPAIFTKEDTAERVKVLHTLSLRRQPVHVRRPGIEHAVTTGSAAVRLAAAAVLERVGNVEDTVLASSLAADSDPRVAAAGVRALNALRTAPPLQRVRPEQAAKRLSVLMDGAVSVHRGKARLRAVEKRNGLIWSRFVVEDQGERIEVDIPGGSLGGYTQVVSEQELPLDGAELIIAQRPEGRPGWAFARDGALYGGWLGQGPAIEWAD